MDVRVDGLQGVSSKLTGGGTMGGRVRVDSTTDSRATTSVTSGPTSVSVTFTRSPYERSTDWQILILLAEIGDLRFFRGEEYQNLFRHLDKTGKFYAERWGDAPSRFPSLLLLSSGEDLLLIFCVCLANSSKRRPLDVPQLYQRPLLRGHFVPAVRLYPCSFSNL